MLSRATSATSTSSVTPKKVMTAKTIRIVVSHDLGPRRIKPA
jgi:hypothetical protein